MLTFLPGPVRGALSLSLFAVNTIFWTFPLLILHLLKLSVPAKGWRVFWSRMQNGIGGVWISFNNWNLRITNPVRWDVRGLDGLSRNQWYLVMANHQSWVDILVLQKVLNRRIPFLKFFLKTQLFWVPFLGLAWWALDYPFLKRSASAGKDLDTILKAAEKFKTVPVSVMNFVEGTRFSPEKREKQRSPYANLLKPKAGGLTFVLNAMRGEFHSILDVTIAYPQGAPSFWEFLCGRAQDIRVRIEVIPIEERILGDFMKDKLFRREFTGWLNRVWGQKDERLAALLEEVTDPGD
jgi:1-acyl-sn-glycerol-3-phosphate acyltransferase